MTLLNAAALGALGLAVPLVILYLLKMKRQDRTVASTLLWAAVIQDLQATHPFQKLRRNLLLFLQLLLLAALAAALARPAVTTSRTEGRSIALVVDCSASMKARDAEDGRRFDTARRLAREVIDSLADGAEAMVIGAGHRPSARTGLTTDRVVLRQAVEALACDDTGTDLDQAMILAGAALRGRAQPEAWLFSDGAGARLQAAPAGAPLKFVRTGKSGENVAITMVDVRPASAARLAELRASGGLEDGRSPFEIFAGLRNFGREPVRGYLTLYFDDRIAGAREIDLPPGGDASVLFSDRFPAGLVRLVFDGKDAFEEDNSVQAYLRPPRETKVALLSPRTPFLERALRSFPFIQTTRVNAETLKGTGFDLVISEGEVPDPLPESPFVVFAPRAAVAGLSLDVTLPYPEITDWLREHPLLDSVDFADVHMAEARSPAEPAGRAILKGTGGAPLATLLQRPGRPWRLVLGFSLTDTDWPLRSSFPIFAWNLVRQAAEADTLVGAAQVRTGTMVSIPDLGTKARIITPSGRSVEVEPAGAGEPAAFAGTTEAGVYAVEWGADRRLRFCCNIADERESDIRPAEEIAVAGQGVQGRASTTVGHRELWPWIAAAVLLVTMFEWYAFHRNLGT